MDIDEDIAAPGNCDCSVDNFVSVVESGDAFSRNEVVLEQGQEDGGAGADDGSTVDPEVASFFSRHSWNESDAWS